MDSFLLSFNLVFPMFLLLALGKIVRGCNILDTDATDRLNALVFKFFLPVSIFKNVYNSSVSEVFDKKLIAYGVGSVVLCFFALLALTGFCKNGESRGVLVQGIYRSNFLIFGLPVAESFYKDGSLSGKASVLIAIIVPVFNTLAVIALEMFKKEKRSFGRLVLNILKNPLIIGSAMGFVGLYLKELGFALPEAVYKTVADISAAATPLALVSLGAALSFDRVCGKRSYLIWGTFGKLIAVPAVFLSIAVILGFRDRELAILFSMYASPASVSSYTMAQQMGADGDLAAGLVVIGTAVSLVTVFLWAMLLSETGLIIPCTG